MSLVELRMETLLKHFSAACLCGIIVVGTFSRGLKKTVAHRNSLRSIAPTYVCVANIVVVTI